MSIEEKVKILVEEIPGLIERFNKWGYRKGPDFYFYKEVMNLVKNNNIKELLKDRNFIEKIYATLTSWDMNSRGAKMKYFDEFYENIISNKEKFIELTNLKLENLTEKDIKEVKIHLNDLYSKLDLMKTGGRIVSNSKVIHYLLPNLVMPIDRKNTLMFFYGNTNESKKTYQFLEIFECSWRVVQLLDLGPYLDDNWNQTIPKIIDNAIIAKMSIK